MSKKQKKAPRVNKTKEQVEAEIKQAQEVKRQRDIVVSKIWPLMIRGTNSIREALQLVSMVRMTVQQCFTNQMKTQTLHDIKLFDQINDKAEKADYVREFLDIFKDEKLTTIVNLTQGVENEIARLLQKEQAERKLATLKTDFVKEDEKPKTDKKAD